MSGLEAGVEGLLAMPSLAPFFLILLSLLLLPVLFRLGRPFCKKQKSVLHVSFWDCCMLTGWLGSVPPGVLGAVAFLIETMLLLLMLAALRDVSELDGFLRVITLRTDSMNLLRPSQVSLPWGCLARATPETGPRTPSTCTEARPPGTRAEKRAFDTERLSQKSENVSYWKFIFFIISFCHKYEDYQN